MNTTTANAIILCPHCGHQHKPTENTNTFDVVYWAEGLPDYDEDPDGGYYHEGDAFNGEAKITTNHSRNQLHLTHTTHDETTHEASHTHFEIQCPNCDEWHHNRNLTDTTTALLLQLGFTNNEVNV